LEPRARQVSRASTLEPPVLGRPHAPDHRLRQGEPLFHRFLGRRARTGKHVGPRCLRGHERALRDAPDRAVRSPIAIEFRAGIPFALRISVRTRFAPSPTGFLHVGGARTALFNWLYARQNGGTFILRIEDTDAARNTQEAYKVIYDGLNWLGLDWDEGPDKGGPFGPYQHIELYQAIGATPPKFAHIPLILNHEGKKLSKRDGGSSITYFLDLGYTPEAVANYLCLLGWSPGENREFLKTPEILSLFDLGQINRRNSIFDLDKCFWLNGQHIQHMTPERFEELALPFVDKAGIPYGTIEALRPALAIVKPKVKHLSDVPDWIGFLFTEDYPFDPEAVAKSLSKPGAADRLQSLGTALAALPDWSHAAIELKLKETAASLGVKAGELVHPARVAVSGRSVGPGLYEMFEVLGKDRTLARFEKARALAA
jgi:glutamyl/glutaminyl-tRNA synthetase